MTIELPTGVKVCVEIPPRVPTVCPSSVPQPGGVTVPVQGALTAEQVAAIVATVTAKVIEAIGGQPGSVSWDAIDDKPTSFPPAAHRHDASDIDGLPTGGGAGINDSVTAPDSTWSSEKIVSDRAPADHTHMVAISEEMPPIPLDAFAGGVYNLAMTAYEASSNALRFESSIGIEPMGLIYLVDALPDEPATNFVYAVRASDGTITLHLPGIGG